MHRNIELLLLNQTSSTKDKLLMLLIVAVFAAVVYMILPKLMNNKLRKYHELDESEEELESDDTRTEQVQRQLKDMEQGEKKKDEI